MRAAAPGDIYQECVQESQRPYPDYAKIQALATLNMAETLREVAGQVAELSRQITLGKDADSPGGKASALLSGPQETRATWTSTSAS